MGCGIVAIVSSPFYDNPVWVEQFHNKLTLRIKNLKQITIWTLNF